VLTALRIGKEKYPALTGIRAVGASVVFFEHFPLREATHTTLNVMAFFFALSGFLIVRIYYRQMEWTRAWLKDYFVNRFARIYPVYLLLLTVAVLAAHETRPWVLASNYTLTHALVHGMHMVIAPSWTLTVEECFYFLAPVFMWVAGIGGFLGSFLLGCLLLSVALCLGAPAFVLSTTFFGNFAEFFAGVYVAFAVMSLEVKGPVKTSGAQRTCAGVAGVAIFGCALIGVYRRVPLDVRAVVLINNFLLPIPIALLYWGLIRESTMLSRFLSGKLCGWLARASYSFYLLHTLIIDHISLPLLASRHGYRPLYVVVTFVATWIAALLLFVLYEEPLNFLIRRRFGSRIGWSHEASGRARTSRGLIASRIGET
jgi:peptidoglycan/LPS O-acetylase OafA/YrhL